MKYRLLSSSVLVVSLGFLIASCGGGGSTQTAGVIGTGGSGDYIPTIGTGPVGGFGSVFLAGVRYDDSKATVDIQDGDDSGGGLKLGMQVRVDGKVLKADTTSGTADRIEMRADMRGPVTLSGRADRFEAMGMRVRINSGTVFEGVKADLSDLQPNDYVHAYGLFSDSRDLIATRVEKKSACPASGCVYKMIGYVTAANASTITLDGPNGGMIVNVNAGTTFSDIANPPPLGAVVRIKSTGVPVTNTLTALSVSGINATANDRTGKGFDEGKLEGIITDLTASTIVVNGSTVNLVASTSVLPAGTALVNGLRATVHAKWVSGVLQASTITVEASQSGDGYEFLGIISNFVSSANFQVKGQTIDASAATVVFKNGTAADLANGKTVDVHGQMVGNVLVATKVEFK